jgi:hypothetical protein
LHCPGCQCVRHALRTTDRAEWGEPKGVRSTHGQDGAIVLDVQQGQMFNLNCVGSRILELLESGVEEPKIVDVISQEFNGKPELVGKDVHEFIEALRKRKLVSES